MIADYTRRGGVRNLERQIGALLRNAAVTIASGESQSVSIDPAPWNESRSSARERRGA